MYYGFGPGGGSLPEWVIRTGATSPMSPANARRDVEAPNVLRTTREPTGVTYKAGGEVSLLGHALGFDDLGRHMRQFPMTAPAASVEEARGAVEALRRVARYLRDRGIAQKAPELVGGPIAALARGEAIVLNWPNGVAIKAAI